MRNKKWFRIFSITCLSAILAMLMSISVGAAGQTIYWGDIQAGVYDLDFPVVNENGENTGFDLNTGAMTKNNHAEDIQIDTSLTKYNLWGGVVGAAVYDQELTDPTPWISPAAMNYSISDDIQVGDLFLIICTDDSYAKVRIDNITASKVYFSYVLESAQPVPSTQPSQPTPQQLEQQYPPAQSSTIILRVNDNRALVNGEPYSISVAPSVINGTTVVPLRFITEALGMQVQFDQSTGTITLTQ